MTTLVSYSEPPRIGGTLVWYAAICSRQVWLMARGVEPDRRDELLRLGRLNDRETYVRDRHDIVFGDNRFDILREEGGALVVAEVKKSSRSLDAARLQLGHYLYELEKQGQHAKGLLLFPKERRREEVLLDDPLRRRLDEHYTAIAAIAEIQDPPPRKRCSYCRSCAYAEWCWS